MTQYIRNGKPISREEFDATARDYNPPGSDPAPGAGRAVGSVFSDSTPQRLYSCGASGAEELAIARDLLKASGVTGVSYDDKGRCFATSPKAADRWGKVFGERVGLGVLADHSGGSAGATAFVGIPSAVLESS